MIIVYRINEPAGQIISLDFETPAAAMSAYLATAEHGDEMAYLAVELDPVPLAELVASVRGFGQRDRFSVDTKARPPQLLDGEAPVEASKAAELLRTELAGATTVAGLRAATLKLLDIAKPTAVAVAGGVVEEAKP